MSLSKLIIVACAAGINTSAIAEDTIRRKLAAEGLNDVEVKRIHIDGIDAYIGRMDMVVWMMKVYRDFGVPNIKGMPFLIGTQEEKDKTLDEIVSHMKSLG